MRQPLTRDLTETVAALEKTEAELLFQADRLRQRTTPDTENERAHLRDLTQGYEDSAKYVRILLNYHKGRLERREVPMDAGIDARGHATPHRS